MVIEWDLMVILRKFAPSLTIKMMATYENHHFTARGMIMDHVSQNPSWLMIL